jgi:hypothetical protein
MQSRLQEIIDHLRGDISKVGRAPAQSYV